MTRTLFALLLLSGASYAAEPCPNQPIPYDALKAMKCGPFADKVVAPSLTATLTLTAHGMCKQITRGDLGMFYACVRDDGHMVYDKEIPENDWWEEKKP